MKLPAWLIPEIEKRWVGLLAKSAATGAVIAGVYGMIHDQITFSISNEYFSEFKFHQFSWADPGLENPRIFVGLIGFLATWWVGGIAGWGLARVGIFCVRRNSEAEDLLTMKNIMKRFRIILSTAAIFGLFGFLSGELMSYPPEVRQFNIVGSIHNFGYLGALVGLVIAGVVLARSLLSHSR